MMGYFVNVFLLSHFCAAQFGEILQAVPFQTVRLGDSVTIKCHIKSEMNKRVWYKLTTRKRLQLVVAFNTRYNRSVFDDEFHRHYSVKFDRINSHLRISATTPDIVGTYFCGVLYLNEIQFGSGTFLMIKGANTISDSVVQQPDSQSVQPGGSVTLNCSVRIDHCAAEHTSVTWLKNSHHSATQMIFSSGIENQTCQRSERGETTCVYDLLMKNLSSDDAGTYYCAVSLCGHALFGNGTRIHVHDTEAIDLSPTMIALMLSSILLGIVMLILIWTLCRIRRKGATDGTSESNQTSEAVIYAAVCSPTRGLNPRPAKVKYRGDSVIYSDIK